MRNSRLSQFIKHRFTFRFALGYAPILTLVVASCLSLNGCTNTPLTDETETGYRLLTDRTVAYSSPVPALSMAARDYVYLAPIEQFANGRWSPSLWVGVASTLDRKFRGRSLAQPTQLELTIDGKIVRLPLAPWDASAEPPINTKVDVQHSLRSVVDHELLQSLASAKKVELTIGRPSSHQQLFSHWRGRWRALDSREAANGVEIAAEAHRPPIIR